MPVDEAQSRNAQTAIVAADSLDGVRDVEGLQVGAPPEGIIPDDVDRVGDRDIRETIAATECVLRDGGRALRKDGMPVNEARSGNGQAAIALTDSLNGVVDVEGLQVGAVAEGKLPDVSRAE
jgi:hypothetical protein